MSARTRARRWFWVLVASAILLMGILYRAAMAEPSPGTAALFLVTAVLLLACATQAVRVWLALDADQRGRSRGGTPTG